MTDHTRPVTGYPAPPASNGYAYPYAAHPHPHPNPNPNPNPPTYFNVAGNHNPTPYQNPYQQRATLLRRLITLFIACIILIGTILFIIWLVLRPQLPHFRLDTLTLANFTVTPNSLISATWTAALTARNPNSKITLYYDHLQAAVFYKSESITVTTVPPFVQGKKNETGVRATFASVSEYVDDLNGLNSERARGTVEFNLRMVARVRFKAGGWWTRRRVLRVYCPHLSVGLNSANSSSGALTGGSRECRVGA